MSAIGSLLFCDTCGNLLDSSQTLANAILTCDTCGTRCKDVSEKTIVTESRPSDFPSALRAKRSQVQTVSAQEGRNFATAQETCPKCGTEEVKYYTQQLRSADEGTTVFYDCPSCGHKWNEDN